MIMIDSCMYIDWMKQGINPVELKGDEDLSQLIAYTSARSIHAVEQLQGQAQGMFEKLRES